MDARINITMPKEFLKRVDQVAREEHRNRSELIREALRNYFTRRTGSLSETPPTAEFSERPKLGARKPSLERASQMKSFAEQAEVQRRLRRFFEQDKDISLVYLFGSYAAKRVGPLSDIDIAVLLDENMPPADYSDKLLELINSISSLLKTDKLDVVILNRAPLGLQYQIVKEGKVVFCQDEDVKTDYECKALNSYLDFKPVEDKYITSLAKKIKVARPHEVPD